MALILTKMMDKCLETTIATGPKRGEKFYLPMIPLSPSETGLPFQFRRRQFPVKHCLAMTISKAQGQTLKVTGLQLQEKFFTHGQFYVGCSRECHQTQIYISVLTTKQPKMSSITKFSADMPIFFRIRVYVCVVSAYQVSVYLCNFCLSVLRI